MLHARFKYSARFCAQTFLGSKFLMRYMLCVYVCVYVAGQVSSG